MVPDTHESIQLGAPSARTSERHEPIRDRSCGRGAPSADRRGQRRMITRGAARSGRVVALETRPESAKRLTAEADATEPTLAGASGGGLHVLGAIDRAMEPAAEMPHAVEPGVANDPRPIEDRLQVAGNDTAL